MSNSANLDFQTSQRGASIQLAESSKLRRGKISNETNAQFTNSQEKFSNDRQEKTNPFITSIDSETRSLDSHREFIKSPKMIIAPQKEFKIPYRNQTTLKSQQEIAKEEIGTSYIDTASLNGLPEIISTPAVKELISVIENFDEKQRLHKAARHLEDALYLRRVRHEVEVVEIRLFKIFYFIQSHPRWQAFLYCISWLFLFLTILEPPHNHKPDHFEENQNFFTPLIILESIILLLFSLELSMESYHLKFDRKRNFKAKYISNLKYSLKFLACVVFWLDYIVFYSSQEHEAFRFSRFFRPFCLAFYQKQLRRTLKAILKSVKQMVEVIVYFLIIAFLYAIVGMALLEEIKTEHEYENDFKSIGMSWNNIYLLFSRDNYPGVMEPYLEISYWYILYFIPFLIVDILVLFPIPVAVMFEAFKLNRGKLVIEDRLREREALFACFFCLDEDFSMTLKLKEFKALFDIVYRDRLTLSQISELFNLMDEQSKKFITIGNFFNVVDLIESHKSLTKTKNLELHIWNKLKNFLRQKLGTQKILSSISFNMIQLALIVAQFILVLLFIGDRRNYNISQAIIYINIGFGIEMMLKLINFGIIDALSDLWTFYELLVSILTILNPGFACLKIVRLYHIDYLELFSKKNHGNRFSHSCKYIRRKLKKIGQNLHEFKALIQNISTCFPIGMIFFILKSKALKLATVILMITYIYAIVGMEIFRTEDQKLSQTKIYPRDFTNFDCVGMAFLTLFQVINGAKWADLQFSYAEKFGFSKASLFFNTYHMLVSFLLLSLLTGLILEIFAFTQEKIVESKKINEILDSINDKTPPKTVNIRSLPRNGDNIVLKKYTSSKKLIPRIVVAQKKKQNIELEVQSILNQVQDFENNQKIRKFQTVQFHVKKSYVELTEVFKMGKNESENSNKMGQTVSTKPGESFRFIFSKEDLLNENDARYPIRRNEKLNLKINKEKLMPKLLEDEVQDSQNKREGKVTFKGNFSRINRSKTENITEIRRSFGTIEISREVQQRQFEKGLSHNLKSYFEHEKRYYSSKFKKMNLGSRNRNQFNSIFKSKTPKKKDLESKYLKIEPMHSSKTISLTNLEKQAIKINLNPTSDRVVIKRALLKIDSNEQEVKKIEYEHLKEIYGSYFFEDQSIEKDRLLNMFEIENRCIIRLARMMRQKLDSNNFLSLIESIEKSITLNLLANRGLFKLIFRDQDDKWFFFKRSMDEVQFEYIANGPWYYYDQIFQQNRVYESNINYPDENKDSIILAKLFCSLQSIADENTYCGWSDKIATKEACIFHAVPIQSNTSKNKMKKKSTSNTSNLNHITIKNCLLISISPDQIKNESGNTFKLERRNSSIKKIFSRDQYKISDSLKRAKCRSQSFIEKEGISEEIKKISLPREELIEMMKDFSDIISKNKENFFKHFSNLYSAALAKEQFIFDYKN